MSRASSRQLLFTLVPSALVLLVVLVIRIRFDVTTSVMTGDVTGTAGLHPLTGFVSSLGVLLWCATASVCFFAAAALPETSPSGARRFLICSGLLTTYLMLDDLFLIHDDLATRYLGLPEAAVFAALGIVAAAYFIAFRRDLARRGVGMLLLAVAFLAASALVDNVLLAVFPGGRGLFFMEDGMKWLGIACWCSYYVRTCHQLVLGTPETSGAERAVRAAGPPDAASVFADQP